MAMNCTVCNTDNETILWPVKNLKLCNGCLLKAIDLQEAKLMMPPCSHEILDEMYSQNC